MSSSLKELKEAHVHGHEGTEQIELLLVAIVPPVVGLLLFHSLASLFCFRCEDRSISWLIWTSLLMETCCFFVPMILFQSSYLYSFAFVYLITQMIFLGAMESKELIDHHHHRIVEVKMPNTGSIVESDYSSTWRDALTCYRSCLMYMTLVAILAVDFPLFPRRFAKTERSGYSLMDLGAASFVVSAGLVSPRVNTNKIINDHNDHRRSIINIKWRSRFLPTLIIGLIRVITHKSIEYQEHHSEYGVHWNFMFTLTVLQLVPWILPGPSFFLPVILLAIYQLLLDAGGLQTWIETAPRSCDGRMHHNVHYSGLYCDLLISNREGLFGCVGYSCLYLISEWIAFYFLWPNHPNHHSVQVPQPPPPSSSSITHLIRLRWMTLLMLLLNLCLQRIVTVSRRSTNAWFCVWVLSVNLTLLTLLQYIIEQRILSLRRRRNHHFNNHKHKQPSSNLLLQHLSLSSHVQMAINQYGFVVFVVANLLTGAINLSMNTLEASDGTTFVILLSYMCINALLSMLLYHYYHHHRMFVDEQRHVQRERIIQKLKQDE